ncbi:hypothetical protein HB364_15440 [Pseudoflavitalea sp. X16]|uniref:hypothetical protein n=1 Tax=Paraflavitalea devenefica TaxID=2716334 RepID=UPI00142173A0|nr:hypothetical protein [Paraflavitalea devenefica]NII26482.1 hypothetical protein [Paraflavitalea devenefica]
MKRSFIVFSLLVAGSAFFPSCNKDLKDDIKTLRNRVETLKQQNSGLGKEADETEHLLGSDEPMVAVTNFGDNNNGTRTVEGTYKFKASDSRTQRMINNGDGSYDIYIERINEIYWYEGAWVAFRYKPATKEIINPKSAHYWDNDFDAYDDRARYDSNLYPNGVTINITVNNFNPATGDIALVVVSSATTEYTSNVNSYYVPNQGKPVSTRLTFSGKLKLFTRD